MPGALMGVKEADVRLFERVLIAAPPAAVWAVLVDWERQAAWMPDVSWIRVVGSQRGAGARLEARTKVLGVPATTDRLVVTTWEPPFRLGIEHAGMVRGSGEWVLDPVGDRTRFTWSESLRMPAPFLGEVALLAYRPVQRALLRRSMRNLRRLVEGSPGP
jgi:carbon monoxide dehydrogenase subunit G